MPYLSSNGLSHIKMLLHNMHGPTPFHDSGPNFEIRLSSKWSKNQLHLISRDYYEQLGNPRQLMLRT